MTRSTRTVWILLAVVISLRCARTAKKADEKRCIEITHVGSEDAPVGALRLCIGEKGQGRADSLIENKWTFFFDATAYRGIEAFVSKHVPKSPVDAGNEVEGSFSITWDGQQYVLPTKTKCTYVRDLVDSVVGDEYAEFRRAGRDLMARERCPSPQK